MKTQTFDGADERRVLIGMIVDDAALARIAVKWDAKVGMFRSKWSNTIGDWCVRFHEKYGKAPRKAIEQRYEAWAAKKRNKEEAQQIGKFLAALSDDYDRQKKELNTDYIIDLAGNYFNDVAFERTIRQAQDDRAAGNLEKAINRIQTFGRVEMGIGSGIDVLRDDAAIARALADDDDEVLIEYPGALGEFFGRQLCRDAFIAFMGANKRGKTWWLLDLAWRAMLQGRKVAFFEVGDLSERQIMRRFMVRAARRPRHPTLSSHPLRYPTRFSRDADVNELDIDFRELHYKKRLSPKLAKRECDKIIGDNDDLLLELFVHPAGSVSVRSIRNTLSQLDRTRDWRPDVVLVDYADILQHPRISNERRDCVNETWIQLRALSQELHCLLATATQTNASSFKADTVDMTMFSEDNRKLAQTTGNVGLSRTNAEKKLGVIKANWVNLREDYYEEGQHVYCAGCLGIANPAVLSTF